MNFEFKQTSARSWECWINNAVCGIAIIDPSIDKNWIIPGGGGNLSDGVRDKIRASLVTAWNSAKHVKSHFVMW